jgi:4-amino-4-deoxy-L-arabinose transferase-like glycosyltransferase
MLLAAVAAVGLMWALLVPPWQGPDAVAHFAYVQSLAERLKLPDSTATRRPELSTDQSIADQAVGASAVAFYTDAVRPTWSAQDYALYRKLAARRPSRSDGGGANSSATNPPFYYLYASLAYWAAYPGDAFDRLYAIDIAGVLLLLTTVAGAWLLAGEVLGPRRLPQVACAAVAGLVPEVTFMETSVNPDAMMMPLWTLAFWLGARVINRAARARDVAALGGVTAAAVLTKGTSYALVPPALLAIALGWARQPRECRRASIGRLASALLTLVVPVLAWVGLARLSGRPVANQVAGVSGVAPKQFNVRQFLSYIWQFYLPRLPWMTPFTVTNGRLSVYNVWVRGAWGTFGWLDVLLPGFIYDILAYVTGAVALAGAALVARLRDRRTLALASFFLLAVVALLGGLHWYEYRSVISGYGPINQGRYLLPLIGLFGLTIGAVLSRMPARARAPLGAAVVAAMLVLQVLSLATIAETYYT